MLPRNFFFCDVVSSITAISDGPTLSHHPGIQILAAQVTDGDEPAIAVEIRHLTYHRRATNVIREGKGGVSPAAPLGAVRPLAPLPTFDRINGMESDPLPMNVDGISVDHGRCPGDGPRLRG